MSIQNAITGLVSTAVGATIAQGIKEEKKITLEKKEKEQYGKALKELPEVEKSLLKSKEDLSSAKKDLDKLKSLGSRINEKSKDDYNKLIKEARFAQKVARQEVRARTYQRKQLRETIALYKNKKGGKV